MENNKQMLHDRRMEWCKAKGIIEGLLFSYLPDEITVTEYVETDRMVKEFFVMFEQITDIMENKEQRKLTAEYNYCVNGKVRWMVGGHY